MKDNYTKEEVLDLVDRYAFYFWEQGYKGLTLKKAMSPEDWLNSEQNPERSVATEDQSGNEKPETK